MRSTFEAGTAALILWLVAIIPTGIRFLDDPSLALWSLMLASMLGLAALTEHASLRFGGKELSYGPSGYLLLFGGLTFASATGWIALVGALVFTGGAIPMAIATFKASKAWIKEDDPLAKGDAACFKQLIFAHRFLAIGALMLVITAVLGALGIHPWSGRLQLSTLHVLLVGFMLLTTYAITHLWVPRFSGVPATAAGAIKGELHTTLLGLTGLVLGFMLQSRGLIAGLGFFVFVGFFTYMGVLGANMMRIKSQTHRVTPEFIYIPWTFTAIFWLICAVVMGLFLNAVPDTFANKYGALRTIHWNAAMVGGVLQMFMGLSTRMVNRTVRFDGLQRLGFFAFNGGLTAWLYGSFTEGSALLVGIILMAIGMIAFTWDMTRLMTRNAPAAA